MKVLVTGASGFLGQAVVSAFTSKGHHVTALVRSTQSLPPALLGSNVSLVVEDLRRTDTLVEVLREIEAVIHLAAGTSGSLDEQLPLSVVATEKLLAAMQIAGVKRLVLASTLSVYDWSSLRSTIDELSPLENRLYERDGYAVAKTWQERLVREVAERQGLELTVLRPGFIWGQGREWVPGAGMLSKKCIFVNGPLRRLPLTHVDNCADCFVAVTATRASIGQTFNVVDTHAITAGRFSRDYARHSAKRLTRFFFPYMVGLAAAHCGLFLGKFFFGKNCKLPGVLLPIRYRARFKSVWVPYTKLESLVGWTPPFDYRACLQLTYPSAPNPIKV